MSNPLYVDVCPGCVGRGTGTECCVCGCWIPEHLRRSPGDPGEYQTGCADCVNGRRHTHRGAR